MILETQTSANNRAWEIMGAALPRDGAIIALTHDYGTYLTYYGYRKVDLWPYTEDFHVMESSGNNPGEDFEGYFARRTAGYRYFLVTQFAQLDAQPDLKHMLEQHYPVIMDGDGYVLYDLSRKQ